MRKAVMTAFLVLMTTGFVSAGMVVDYFDYGPANGELGGQGAAASGWAGSWIAPLSLASFGPDYRADVNLSYVADGYDGTANSAGTGMAGYVKSTSPGYMTKRYFSTPATGTVWLSAILNYSASGADLLIWIDPPESGTGDPPVFIGVRSGAAKMRYGSDLTGPAVSVGTHLLLAKMEVDPAGIDTVSLWIDPDLSAGEAGLGAPGIVGSTLDKFGDSISGVAFSCSEHKNLGIDALRISADVDGFAQVTSVPEPMTLAMLAMSGLLVIRRRRA